MMWRERKAYFTESNANYGEAETSEIDRERERVVQHKTFN
jgi:hypothetical protein